jgi:signal transduction histidine kinase
MQSDEFLSSDRRSWSFERLFDSAKKDTVIRLRWPLVILSSYLLYYAPSHWLTPTQVQSLLILYLLSHATLYFVADELFDSPYLYGPLLLFDTFVLLAVLEIGGSATPDFFVACLFTLVLSCVCNDFRGLLAVTILAPLIYGYSLFNSTMNVDPGLYLRLPFPFVISLFYGYFAQVDRLRRRSREKDELVKRQQRAAEELRRQRERLEALHRVNVSLTSTIDINKILDAFLTSVLGHLPYAAGIVRLRNPQSGAIETAAAQGVEIANADDVAEAMQFIDGVATEQKPLSVDNVFADPQAAHLEHFRMQGLVSLLVLPLVANNETLGCLVFFTRDEHRFGSEEVDFLSTVAGQAAIAIHHAQLYHQSRQQADALRNAHEFKDAFLRSVSTKLKTPLSVITGYSDMFRNGLLGETTPIQAKAIETVARQAKELQGLIHSVLLVTQMESEPPHVELHDLDLWEFLSELRAKYGEPLGKPVRLVWVYPADLPTVQGDRGKLKRIFENLIDNAIQFTNRGSITVGIRYSARRKRLEIKVADSGVGIPPAQIAAIFEWFRQAESAEAGLQGGGFGLGLYVVKRFVDLLGGSIRVDSRVGEGSTFSLEIPAPIGIPLAAQEPLPRPAEGTAQNPTRTQDTGK